jgi:hypothetical protein
LITSCTTIGDPQAWCATKVDENLNMINWDYCPGPTFECDYWIDSSNCFLEALNSTVWIKEQNRTCLTGSCVDSATQTVICDPGMILM